MAAPRPILTQQRLLVCEGREDQGLIEALMDAGRIPTFDVTPIGDDPYDAAKGKDALAPHLKRLVGRTGFRGVERVAIIVDSDQCETAAFELVATALISANADVDVCGRYGVPDQPRQSAEADLITTVILLPGNGERGCLDTVLWRVIKRKYPDAARCVEGLIACAGVTDGENPWNNSKIDKAMVRSSIAILLKENPAQALSYLWKRYPDLIPVSEPEFDDLVNVLVSV